MIAASLVPIFLWKRRNTEFYAENGRPFQAARIHPLTAEERFSASRPNASMPPRKDIGYPVLKPALVGYFVEIGNSLDFEGNKINRLF